MKGLLLIGGLATRLLPLSKDIAKSLLPVLDRELLHYQIGQLAQAGIGEIILAAGHQVEQLREYVSHYSGIDIQISVESEPRGTAGAIANARELIGDEPLVVLNADILSSIDLGHVIEVHEEQGRVATLVGFGVEDASRFGLFKLRELAGAEQDDDEGHSGNGHDRHAASAFDGPGDTEQAPKISEIIGFLEKPQGYVGEPPHYINAGIYVLEPEAVAAIPDGRPVSIEREIFPQLLQQHGSFTHFPLQGLWADIGTFEGYFKANFSLLARRFTFGDSPLWGQRDDCAIFKDLVYLHKSVRVEPGADLYHRVALMQGCIVGSGSRLQDCLLMPGARVGEGCQVKEAILGPGVEVPSGASVQSQVLVAGEEPVPFFLSAELRQA
ncbi:NDP-sugar synthase [bacterium]|nr:NDP-sugar synthase [bacterium]